MFSNRIQLSFVVTSTAALLFTNTCLVYLLMFTNRNCDYKPIFVASRPFQNRSSNDSAVKVRAKNSAKNTELKPWSDFKLDNTFVQKHCQHILDITRWASKKSHLNPVICYTPGDHYISAFITRQGNWEIWQQEILFKNVFPNFPKAAFMDVGANMGVFSISAGLLGRRVFAFEPMPETLKTLSHSLVLNNLLDEVVLYPYGLLDSTSCVYSKLIRLETNKGKIWISFF